MSDETQELNYELGRRLALINTDLIMMQQETDDAAFTRALDKFENNIRATRDWYLNERRKPRA